jgi:excinuclease ABC subunit A
VCARPIERQSASEIVERLVSRYPGARALLLAPVVRGRKGEYRKLFAELKKQGFARVRLDGVVQTIDEAVAGNLERYEKHDIEVVVDRVKIDEADRSRLAESAELALGHRRGADARLPARRGVDELYSERFACPEHGTFLEELEPRVFSFNTPYGACAHCSGLGHLQQFDPDLVVPDESLSIAQGAIAPWTGARSDGGKVFYWDRLRAIAEHHDVDLATPGATCRRPSATPCCTAPRTRSRSSTAAAVARRCASRPTSRA